MRDKDLRGFWRAEHAPDKPSSGYKKRKRKREKRRLKKLLRNKKSLCSLSGNLFYRTKAWKRLRRKVIDQYGYRCMSCGDVDTEIHVDHIQPRSRAPELSMTFDNLQVLCKDCNQQKSNIHAEDYREKAVTEMLDLDDVFRLRGWI